VWAGEGWLQVECSACCFSRSGWVHEWERCCGLAGGVLDNEPSCAGATSTAQQSTAQHGTTNPPAAFLLLSHASHPVPSVPFPCPSPLLFIAVPPLQHPRGRTCGWSFRTQGLAGTEALPGSLFHTPNTDQGAAKASRAACSNVPLPCVSSAGCELWCTNRPMLGTRSYSLQTPRAFAHCQPSAKQRPSKTVLTQQQQTPRHQSLISGSSMALKLHQSTVQGVRRHVNSAVARPLAPCARPARALAPRMPSVVRRVAKMERTAEEDAKPGPLGLAHQCHQRRLDAPVPPESPPSAQNAVTSALLQVHLSQHRRVPARKHSTAQPCMRKLPGRHTMRRSSGVQCAGAECLGASSCAPQPGSRQRQARLV
jgi:hypothetical protein